MGRIVVVMQAQDAECGECAHRFLGSGGLQSSQCVSCIVKPAEIRLVCLKRMERGTVLHIQAVLFL